MVECLFRLEHDQDNTRESSQTYIVPRMLPIMHTIIWGSCAVLFRTKIRATIHGLCPLGKLSALGGKQKRNLLTLGIW